MQASALPRFQDNALDIKSSLLWNFFSEKKFSPPTFDLSHFWLKRRKNVSSSLHLPQPVTHCNGRRRGFLTFLAIFGYLPLLLLLSQTLPPPAFCRHSEKKGGRRRKKKAVLIFCCFFPLGLLPFRPRNSPSKSHVTGQILMLNPSQLDLTFRRVYHKEP